VSPNSRGDSGRTVALTQHRADDAGATLHGLCAHGQTAPLFLISESLGSKIVVDSLQEFENKHQTESLRNKRAATWHTLFLLANQIPILNLGVRDESGEAGHLSTFEDLATERNEHRNPRLPNVPLHVVAFSDPNDIFSYQLNSQRLSVRAQ